MKSLCLSLLVIMALPLVSQQPSNHSDPSKLHTTAATDQGSQDFAQSCESPAFPSEPTLVDSACGVAGSGGAETAQNKQKDDFCASGDPEAIDFDKLKELQTQVANDASINWGNRNAATHQKGPATDRAHLQQIGEGKLVSLNGFVFIARQEGKESVNCGPAVPNQPVYHDIHISIVNNASEADECNSVVVEMSPHHRPVEWSAENVEKLAKSHTPVRVTGHLFFDSSHVPCVSGQSVAGNPKRFSLWEIHPVYKFEVCTENCNAQGTWSDFADFVKSTHENSAAKSGSQ